MTDIVERAKSWDRCYPGNLNIEMLVNDMTAEIERLRRAPDLAEALRNALLDLPDDILWYLDEMDDEEARELANAVRRARSALASLSRPSVMAVPVDQRHDWFKPPESDGWEQCRKCGDQSWSTPDGPCRALSASPSPDIGKGK